MEYEHSARMANDFENTQRILQQPHVYMKPKVFRDGDMWCCSLGNEEFPIAVVAFGDTPEKAAQNWDLVWYNGDKNKPKLPPPHYPQMASLRRS